MIDIKILLEERIGFVEMVASLLPDETHCMAKDLDRYVIISNGHALHIEFSKNIQFKTNYCVILRWFKSQSKCFFHRNPSTQAVREFINTTTKGTP